MIVSPSCDDFEIHFRRKYHNCQLSIARQREKWQFAGQLVSAVIANQSADWCGNLLRFLPDSRYFGSIRGIPTPVALRAANQNLICLPVASIPKFMCALARNDML